MGLRCVALKFKLELDLPFVHCFLMGYLPPDDGLIQPNSRREESGRPPHRSPVGPLQLGIPEPKLPTQIRFHLAHNTRNPIFRRNHQHDMYVINLHTPLLDLHIGVIGLDLRYRLLHKHLDRPPQNTSPVFGDSHHMVLVLIGPMSTEANFHALVSSKTPHVARSPPLPAGSAFTHGLTPRGPRR